MALDPSLLSPPLSASTVGSRRNKFFAPLSDHGMPKAPSPPSPGSIRSDRFGNLHSPRSSRSTSITSPPMTPMSFHSQSFMSPPLSARSFGTFIESTPSTPAFSPRQHSTQWDGSALIFLSPVPSTTTSSPPEPEWDMMTAGPESSKPLIHDGVPSGLGISPNTSLASHPTRTPHGSMQKENVPPTLEDARKEPETECKAEEEEPSQSDTLEKLASRVRSILRRKPASEKKSRRRRRREEMDYVRAEDVHWTEM
ncbi:hypothetical protein BDV96DRAFT_653670 [Lophiotrema nucula]|uniref:Uncharacterized protein n=1 Tax=Lophiotrema nucula TaxID=690887 RepID=A0A6A5YMZ8_9PLEO|nr:hypothetical protein BDV96DRAFT_653670 [Lophiotrema nucula]